jgi:hypothetical protein
MKSSISSGWAMDLTPDLAALRASAGLAHMLAGAQLHGGFDLNDRHRAYSCRLTILEFSAAPLLARPRQRREK